MLKKDFDLKNDHERFDFFREMNNFADFLDEIKNDFPDYDDYDERGHEGLNVKGRSIGSIRTIIAREDGEADKGVKDGTGKGKSAAGPADTEVPYTSHSKGMFDLGIFERDLIQEALGRKGISVLMAHSKVSKAFFFLANATMIAER